MPGGSTKRIYVRDESGAFQEVGYLAENVAFPVSIVDGVFPLATRFTQVLKFEASDTEEIRRDETETDDFNGIAPDGTATNVASWDIVRLYKTDGKVVRARLAQGIAWDDRANEANWS
jgi:hypothetical protein